MPSNVIPYNDRGSRFISNMHFIILSFLSDFSLYSIQRCITSAECRYLFICFNCHPHCMSRREERERTEYSQRQQQHEAINRSIDETKDNIRRAIEEVRRETPRYSQTVTDFQNETAEATREIADNFLDSQKEVINSMQSAWAPVAQRTGGGYYWTGMMILSPREMAEIYARTIGAMTEAYVASTRMATNMVFAGMEAARASTNYARQNVKEGARITSNTARTFAQTAAKETVQVEGEQPGGSTTGSSSFAGVGGAAAS